MFRWQITWRGNHCGAAAFFLLLTGLTASPSAYAGTEVNTCGQAFSGSGFLAADMDCTGFSGDAVVINNGGSLDLRGFTLTGGDLSGVFCSTGCKVFSQPPGGQIINSGSRGIDGDRLNDVPGVHSVRVKDVIISNSEFGQIDVYGNVTVENCTLTGTGALLSDGVSSIRSVKVVNTTVSNADFAVAAVEGIRVVDSQIHGLTGGVVNGDGATVIQGSTISGASNACAFADERLRVTDSTISGCPGDGIRVPIFARVRVVNSQITSNGSRGIATDGGRQLVLKDAVVSGNGEDGVYHPDRAKIINSTISSNGLNGVNTGPSSMSLCGPVVLRDSTVTANGTDGAVCGVSQTCADLATCTEAARLLGTSTCETSYDTDSGFPGASWGICTLD